MLTLLLLFTFAVGMLSGFLWGFLLGVGAGGEAREERLALSDGHVALEIQP